VPTVVDGEHHVSGRLCLGVVIHPLSANAYFAGVISLYSVDGLQ